MNQALLSKQAAEDNTAFLYGTVQAEIHKSSPAAVALASVLDGIAEELSGVNYSFRPGVLIVARQGALSRSLSGRPTFSHHPPLWDPGR